jgi:hypothetical protein
MHVESDPNVFRALEREWRILGPSPAAVAALARWRCSEPGLGTFASPAEIVQHCQRRGEPRASNATVGSLLRVAADPFAARTLLQALLPSVAARAWRATRLAGDRGLASVADWNQEMVLRVLERTRELAGSSPPWPAAAIVESAWWRVETAIAAEHRRRRYTVPLDRTDGPSTCPDRTPAEELVAELVHAVRSHRIDARAAGVIYTTRIRGHSFEQVAAWDGRGVAALRKARLRAETVLVVGEGR